MPADSPVVGMDPVQVLADSPLMRGAGRSSLDGLRAELESVALDEDALLRLDGTGGGALYFVASGRLEIVQSLTDGGAVGDQRVLATIVPGDVVSEMRAPTGDEGAAVLRAATEAHLVTLSKERFDRHLGRHPEISGRLRTILSPRFYHRELVRVLGEMFGDLTEELLGDIEQRLAWRHVAREDVLVRQGEPAEGLFVIVSGRLRELAETGGGTKVVHESAAGQVVGSISVFSDTVQSTTVVAARDSMLLEFSREGFRELAGRYPKLHEWLARLLSIRLHGVLHETRPRQPGTNILLVPASDGAPLEEFARQLAEALSRGAACALVTSARLDALLGVAGIAQAPEGSPEDLRLRAWLQEQETHHRYTIYVPDPTLTNWTRLCNRQADEVVAVGVATAAPGLTEVEAETLRSEGQRRAKSRMTLVLLHPPSTVRPRGTERWLKERRVDRHFHLRESDRGDLERFVRYVSGSEVGLVLSGGGSRGFAHAGVIRAIGEAGLPIDMIAGVSMGAIIGAAFALTEDFDARVRSLKERFRKAFGDYTLPFVSLTRGRRFDRMLQSVFGDANIEDLSIPYFCVSSNITRADIVVHRAGPVWWSLRATSSLPGLVPPVVHNGELLYDGCLLNNLPMDVMREEIKGGRLVAVDVVPPLDADLGAVGEPSSSGWRIAWNRINPWGPAIRMPGIVSVLQRAGTLGSIYNRQRMISEDIADLYIRPPVEQLKILDTSVADEADRLGYAHGVTELAAWARHER